MIELQKSNHNTKQMKIDSEKLYLRIKLKASKASHVLINTTLIKLKFIEQEQKNYECFLNFQVSPETYQAIDTEALFNLKSEIRSPISEGKFNPSFDIEIEATLDPALLPKLAANATNAEEAAAYLQKISQEQPDNPILSTYSWYALEVKQKHDRGETKYTTLWKYLNPSLITPDGIDSDVINQAMNTFAKDWADTNGSGIAEDVITQVIEEMTHSFEELTNSFSEMTQEVVSETMTEMNSALEELADSFSEIAAEIDLEQQSIFDIVINFFKQEEWQFQMMPEKQTLRLIFQGNNGKWDCYAKARESKKQFVFYSVCPINAPESKLQAIAEFITRANYGMIMGNFELDFNQGEIRYKTSIDVEGDQLTLALIKQIVYANIMMMDEYLPGIIAVIKHNLSAEKAIAQIEA